MTEFVDRPLRRNPTEVQIQCFKDGGHQLSHLKRDEDRWPWKNCQLCGFRIWTTDMGEEIEPDYEVEIEGWRVIPTDDHKIAVDNGPLVKAARIRGENHPEFYSAVLPLELIHAIDKRWY